MFFTQIQDFVLLKLQEPTNEYKVINQAVKHRIRPSPGWVSLADLLNTSYIAFRQRNRHLLVHVEIRNLGQVLYEIK